MKHITLYWIGFFVLLGTLVASLYTFDVSPEIAIISMITLYLSAQIGAMTLGIKRDDPRWIASGIVVQALFAVVSPLYYSNFGDPVYEYITGTWLDSENAFFPCHLCWWARIMMFPIVPLSIIFLITKQRGILWYIYLISIPGILLEAFHFILQKPEVIGRISIVNPFGCTDANPCAAAEVAYFGFMTIPFLCMIAFIIIHVFAGVLLFRKKLEK